MERCFLKIGDLITGIDDLPTVKSYSSSYSSSSSSSYITEYSFLVFGVIFLSFVYVASFLPSKEQRVLPSTVQEFNGMFGPKRSDGETDYLLNGLSSTLETDVDHGTAR